MRFVRLICIFLVIACVFACLSYFMSEYVVVQGVDGIEKEQAIKGMEQTLERIEFLESQLSWRMRSTTANTQTYDALSRQNREYFETRFSPDYLRHLYLSSVFFYLDEKTPFFVSGAFGAGPESVTAEEAELNRRILHRLFLSEQDSIDGLVSLNGETCIMVAQKVCNASLTETLGACIVLKTLAREFASGAETNALARYSVLPHGSYDAVEAATTEKGYKIAHNFHEIFTYALLQDVFGQDICCLEARSNRILGILSQIIARKNFLTMFGIGLLFLAIAIYLMHHIERRMAREELLHRLQHDGLTGLLNKSTFLERLEHALEKEGSQQKHISVFFINLDRFHTINDTNGYQTGDHLLYEVGQRLAMFIPRQNLSRFDGDKFCLFVECEEDDCESVACSIRESLCPSFTVDQKEIVLSSHMGIASFPRDEQSPQKLIQYAELAMYHARRRGTGSFAFFTPAMAEEIQKRATLENDLIQALDDSAMTVFYQPKVDVREKRVVGGEALIRWQTSAGVWIPPPAFIPLAEETGLVTRVDMFVLRTACRQVKKWIADGYGSVCISVNMSGCSILQEDFAGSILHVLHEEAVPLDAIEIEITETSLMQDLSMAAAGIRELHSAGVHIALDDFGTGYSSLRYLHAMPITCLKIDKSFIDGLAENMEDDEASMELVRGTIALAHGLGKDLVAEGVEDRHQLQLLMSYGCFVIQGYLFSKPLSSADFSTFLAEHRERIDAAMGV